MSVFLAMIVMALFRLEVDRSMMRSGRFRSGGETDCQSIASTRRGLAVSTWAMIAMFRTFALLHRPSYHGGTITPASGMYNDDLIMILACGPAVAGWGPAAEAHFRSVEVVPS